MAASAPIGSRYRMWPYDHLEYYMIEIDVPKMYASIFVNQLEKRKIHNSLWKLNIKISCCSHRQAKLVAITARKNRPSFYRFTQANHRTLFSTMLSGASEI